VPTLCRRSFVTGAAVAVSANIVLSGCYAQTSQSGPFQLPPLAYPNNALEPHIDARTMEFHHDRHHGAAVAALNAALKDHGQVAQMRIEQMLFKLAELPEDIRTAVLTMAAVTPTTPCSGRSWARTAGRPIAT
jgi:Fe-Mn family superoxide dismutase